MLVEGRYAEAAAVVAPLMADDERWPERWLSAAATADVATTLEALAFAEPYLATRPHGAITLADHWLGVAGRSGEAAHFDQAEEFALKAGEDDNLAIVSLHIRASLAEGREDSAATESLYRQVLDRSPDDLRALNNLALTLVQVDRCDEAAALLERALGLYPQNPHVLDTHAQALACRGDFAQAETAARMALSSRPDNPSTLLTLARILIAQIRLAEAEDELDRAQAILRTSGQTGGPSWSKLEALRNTLEVKQSQSVR